MVHVFKNMDLIKLGRSSALRIFNQRARGVGESKSGGSGESGGER
jgi:hypothetical protein